MTPRRWIAAVAVALLGGGGFIATRWFLASDSPTPIAGSRGSTATSPGATAPAATTDGAHPVDDRFPPRLTGANDLTRPGGSDLERIEEAAQLVITARVVDAARAPVANVPVALGVPGSERQDAIVARSGRDGLARIAGYEAALALEDPGARWTLHFPFPEIEPTAVPIDPRHPPTEPVEIVAPALGRLVVKLVDGANRPIATRGFVALDVEPQGGGDGFPGNHKVFPLTAPDELVVDPIAIGLRVRAEAVIAEYSMEPAEADGPQRQGETATLVMKAVRHGPVLIGQLIGPDGKPVASLPLSGIVHDDPDLRVTIGDVALATDGEGRFRFDASQYEIEDPDRKRWLDLVDRNDRDGMGGRARAPVPTPFLSGELDVGRVDFELAPPVVSGRVVAFQGSEAAAAVPAANVQICVCPPQQSANPAMRRRSVGTVLVARSGEGGEFTIHGFVEREELAVFAIDEKGRQSAPVRFLPGATGVELTIVELGSLEGSLVMDPAIDSIHVGVFFRRSGVGDDGVFETRVAPTRDGAFRWDGVPAGRIDVAVGLGRYSDRPEVALVVPGVEVKANTLNHDPRLEGLDLRARIRKARVEIFDPEGQPLQSGTVTLLANDEAHSPVLSLLISGGVVDLPQIRPTFDVEVRSNGLAVERRFGLVSPARITMRAGTPVVIELEPPLAPREDGPVSLRLILSPVGLATGVVPAQQRADLGADGKGTLLLSEAGRFKVDLDASCDLPAGEVEARTRWYRLRAELDEAFVGPILEIPEGGGAQRIVVPLPAAARAVIETMFREFAGG